MALGSSGSTDVYVHKVTGLIETDTYRREFAEQLTPDEMGDISSAAVNKIQDFVKKQPPGAMLYVFNAGEQSASAQSPRRM